MSDMTTPQTAATAEPLDVPARALEVDLAQAFGQLLYRSSLLQRLRAEDARSARSAQRELLGVLVEVDDALAALRVDRELDLIGRGAGIEATRRRLLGKLARAGVRPMRLDGLAADPALTEIVGTEVRPGLAPETVVETVVTGFFWNDEVLRRAQVVVAEHPPQPEAGPLPDTVTEEAVVTAAAGAVRGTAPGAVGPVTSAAPEEAVEAVEPAAVDRPSGERPAVARPSADEAVTEVPGETATEASGETAAEAPREAAAGAAPRAGRAPARGRSGGNRGARARKGGSAGGRGGRKKRQ